MTRRAHVWFAPSMLVIALVASCASVSDAASTRALNELSPSTTDTADSATSGSQGCVDPSEEYQAGLAATEPPASAGQTPPGPTIQKIRARGRLYVGVDENTRYFSLRDPESGTYDGFEVELAQRIASEIFGDDDPNLVRFVPVVTANKVKAVVNGDVDMTISVVSKNCKRWQEVDFTTTYFETSQGVLVPSTSDNEVNQLADLKDRRVCVTSGSSSEDYVNEETEAIAVPVEMRNDCLVALQERRVDAVVLPKSILAGLAAQDGSTRILTDETNQPQYYGIPIAKEHPDLVRFVNDLFERWRFDGTLERLQEQEDLPQELRVTSADLEQDKDELS